MKAHTLSEILTPEELQEAMEIYRESLAEDGPNFLPTVVEQLINPLIPRITVSLGEAPEPMRVALAILACIEFANQPANDVSSH